MRAHATTRHRGWILPAVAMVLAALGPWGAIQHAGAQTPSPGVPTGQLLFSDDFSDPGSGWGGDTLSSGAVFAYGTDEYLITPAPGHVDFNGAPYAEGRSDLIQAVDIGLPSGSANKNEGAGLTCGRPSTSDAQYHFFVWPDGNWAINRRDGSTSEVVVIIHGHMEGNGVAPGATISVVSVCETVGSGQDSVSHLSFFIQGHRVADVNDPWSLSAESGWRGGIVATGSHDGPQQIVHFTHFSISTGAEEATPSGSSTPTTTPPVAVSDAKTPWISAAGIAAAAVLLGTAFIIRGRRRRDVAPINPSYPGSMPPPPPPPPPPV